MKISLDWLRQYIDVTVSVPELAAKLTSLGIEVDAIEDFASKFDKIVVGEVLEVERHPNADKLSLTQVTIGSGEPLRIVCGAPNVAKGMKVAVATIGADLGDGFVIKKSKIRGEPSEGMLCSERELGLSESHDGIISLPSDAKIGSALAEALGKSDVIFEIGITPNRADCLSHIGIAREVALAFGGKVRKGDINTAVLDTSRTKTSSVAKVTIADPDLCPRYAVRVVRGVKVAESPEWLKQRLEAVGLRPRNNIVDVTNFVMMECGHPLHAFDFSTVQNGHIIVRTSDGFADKFITLDDKERNLPSSSLLIADSEKPLAVAGVMGGANSEITHDTTDVLIESAYFNPSSIRKTARLLGISSDAAYRFERGTDIENVLYALDRSAALIAELSGGEILDGVIDEYPKKREPKTSRLRPDRCRMLLGAQVSDNVMEDIFRRLDIIIDKTDAKEWKLTGPSWRVDLEIEEDAIEEIARVHGLENIPSSTFERAPFPTDRDRISKRMFDEQLRSNLIAIGFSECVSTPIISAKEADLFGGPAVEVMNPLTVELERMRPSILPNLLDAARRNERFQAAGQKLFEMGSVFRYADKAQQVGNVEERGEIGFLIKDIVAEKNVFNTKELRADIYLARSVCEHLLKSFHVDVTIAVLSPSQQLGMWQKATQYFEGSEALAVLHGKNVLAIIGKVHSTVEKAYDLRSPAYVGLVDYELLHTAARKAATEGFTVKPLAKYPAVERDMAFTIKSEVLAAQLVDEVRASLPKEFVEGVGIFDMFESKEMKQRGERSLAVRIKLRSQERTLEDEEVERIVSGVVNTIETKFGAKLRA
jgi:phenylalanyl-tRNA synthetase beta chain